MQVYNFCKILCETESLQKKNYIFMHKAFQDTFPLSLPYNP